MIHLNLAKYSRFFYPLLVIFSFLIIYCSPMNGTLESDSYYHFAISKIMSEQGFIRALPQLEDLGWSNYFPEKEFLFHQITALAYKLGGVIGIQIVSNVFGALIIVLLVLIGELLSSRITSLAITSLILMNVNFFFRLTLIRPHLSGILIALIILLGLIKNNKWILAIGCLLFPLFYHAFYIPLLFMGTFCISEKFKNLKYLLLFGIIPMAVGIIINPYFPSNLMMTWLGIKIAFSSGQSINVGSEARPLGFLKTIDMIGPLVILSLALLTQFKTIFSSKSKILPLLIITLSLEIFFFFSPRVLEYLIPMSALLLISTVPLFTERFKHYKYFLCLLLLAVNIRYVGYLFLRQDEVNLRSQDLLSLVSKLPEGSNEKVFSCEWDVGSFILYSRPSLRMVEILDPNFLYMHDPTLGKVKDLLMIQPSSRLYEILTDLFKADYILCPYPVVVKQLEQDKRFVKIAQGNLTPVSYLFKILKD